MSAQIIDGKAIAQTVREQCRLETETLTAEGITPGLAVIIIGEDAASKVYVRNKIKACHDAGLHSENYELPSTVTQPDLLSKIAALNNDPAIHGILVQLPLPAHIDQNQVIGAIAVDKDVDGFHLHNVGALMVGNATFPPCTPHGVMCLLEHSNITIEGKNAVVVGRSNIVGKPMAMMLLHKNATVSICTSKTQDLKFYTSMADILVVATGKPQMITGDMIKPGAVVIDVGINRLADNRLVGDVDFDSVKETAGYITPVPGGVGPMTIAMLVANTVRSAQAKQ